MNAFVIDKSGKIDFNDFKAFIQIFINEFDKS